MRILWKAFKAIAAAPFYTYKTYQLQKEIRSILKKQQNVQAVETPEFKPLINLTNLQDPGGKSYTEFQYRTMFERQANPVYMFTSTPLIIDCGAYIGMFSLYCKYLYPQARILAYEADPRTYPCLEANLKKVDNVEFFHKAISDETGVLKFNSLNDTASSACDNYYTGNHFEVPSISLREVIEQQETVHLLKIDIEGSETIALQSCDGHLSNVEQIVVEFHDIKSSPQQNLATLAGLLERNNFVYSVATCDHLTKDLFAATTLDWNMNFIIGFHAVRKDLFDAYKAGEISLVPGWLQ